MEIEKKEKLHPPKILKVKDVSLHHSDGCLLFTADDDSEVVVDMTCTVKIIDL